MRRFCPCCGQWSFACYNGEHRCTECGFTPRYNSGARDTEIVKSIVAYFEDLRAKNEKMGELTHEQTLQIIATMPAAA